MASIVKRGKSYSVIYYVTDAAGRRQQKWVSCKTLADLLTEYIALHGKNVWAMSTYTSNVGLIDHYIRPFLGEMKLSDITTRVLD